MEHAQRAEINNRVKTNERRWNLGMRSGVTLKGETQGVEGEDR